VVIFPHCKINLGLNVIQKRNDGYHDLETFFLPIPLYDCLEAIRDPQHTEGIQFSTSGIPIPGEASQNLCMKAYELLTKDFPDLPPVLLHLHKNIPTGAGLGGGSSDGAFTLRLLNSKFRLGLSVEQLAAYALALGSDAPFFVQDKPCLATGRGEILETSGLSLSGYTITLVNPGLQVATAWAFSQLIPKTPPEQIRNVIRTNPELWKDRLVNDFEKPVFEKYPKVGAIKKKLYAAGADYASLSGSGSTVFGIFKGEVPKLEWEPGYFVKDLNLGTKL